MHTVLRLQHTSFIGQSDTLQPFFKLRSALQSERLAHIERIVE